MKKDEADKNVKSAIAADVIEQVSGALNLQQEGKVNPDAKYRISPENLKEYKPKSK